MSRQVQCSAGYPSIQWDFYCIADTNLVILQDLGAALAARNLQDAIGNSGSNQLFILLTADVVERQAICDNQVCEAGERPSSVNGANGGNANTRENKS